MKRPVILRCHNCGEPTLHYRILFRLFCIVCNTAAPQRPAAWGDLAILLFLVAVWMWLTHSLTGLQYVPAHAPQIHLLRLGLDHNRVWTGYLQAACETGLDRFGIIA
jgi:hypothetical protein